jgi:hypothetical protein
MRVFRVRGALAVWPENGPGRTESTLSPVLVRGAKHSLTQEQIAAARGGVELLRKAGTGSGRAADAGYPEACGIEDCSMPPALHDNGIAEPHEAASSRGPLGPAGRSGHRRADKAAESAASLSAELSRPPLGLTIRAVACQERADPSASPAEPSK